MHRRLSLSSGAAGSSQNVLTIQHILVSVLSEFKHDDNDRSGTHECACTAAACIFEACLYHNLVMV